MFYQREGKKLYLNCSIQPKARETRVVGAIGERLKIRLTAAAADGKANQQLIKFLAKAFQVKQNAVSIVSGSSSRQKRLCIDDPMIEPLFLTSPNS